MLVSSSNRHDTAALETFDLLARPCSSQRTTESLLNLIRRKTSTVYKKAERAKFHRSILYAEATTAPTRRPSRVLLAYRK